VALSHEDCQRCPLGQHRAPTHRVRKRWRPRRASRRSALCRVRAHGRVRRQQAAARTSERPERAPPLAAVWLACVQRTGRRQMSRGERARSLGSAVASAPVAAPACGRGGEIATVGTPRRFRGSSKRAGISQERVSGRAGARRSSVGTAQAAPWSPARVNMRACMLSNGISCYRDTISRVCHSIGPRVLLLVL